MEKAITFYGDDVDLIRIAIDSLFTVGETNAYWQY